MKTRLPILLIALAPLALVLGCSKQPPAPISAPSAPAELTALKRLVLAPTQVTQEVKFDGVIEAINQATVSAQTSGRVVELPVDVGDVVKKGDLIVRFTDVEQKARAASAQAKFAEARAQYTRMQDMLAKQLIAKADFDKAEAAFKSLDAARTEADEGAANTAIYAPYAGILVSRHIKVGETVAPGTPLLTGLSLEQLRAQVDIPQQHIGPVRRFKQARVLLPDGSVLATSDLRIPPSADTQTHSFKVLVNLPPGDHGLFPGTLIKIAFASGTTEQLAVPASAIARRGEVTGVYVITQNSLDLRLVRLGTKTADDRYPILAGLSAGDSIALDPISAAQAYSQLNGARE